MRSKLRTLGKRLWGFIEAPQPLSAPGVQMPALGADAGLASVGLPGALPPLPVREIQLTRPIDDPNMWARTAMYDAPAAVDVERCQKEIDAIYGTTRGGEPIMKLVWNGDRRYWHELFMSWDATGKPNAPVVKRPRVRFKALRDKNDKLIRDVFPPRWLILVRLEPEQYPNYAMESWIWDPAARRAKCMRPDTPPSVYWLWFATIAKHNDHCCSTARKHQYKCYGEYAPPQFIYDFLGSQKRADEAAGLKFNPFEAIDQSMISELEAGCNGYEYEIQQLAIEHEIYVENPMALIGPAAAIRAGIDTPAKARQVVDEFYDRKKQEAASGKGERNLIQ